MMGQTFAIFIDAYRELQSRKLFWITLVLSALVVAIFALVGIDKQGLSIAGWHIGFASGLNTDVVPVETFYKQMFLTFGIGVWLTWIATILALVSTAGMIPDLISSGSIELVLSHPIGRWRLFLTKYVAGLLFVTLQVSVFTAASFVVLGLRGGTWEPGLFIAVPVVVAFFSYLFCLCALLGMMTRSTIAALLLTLLAWFCFYLLHTAEATLLMFRIAEQYKIETLDASIAAEQQAAADEDSGDADPDAAAAQEATQELPKLEEKRQESQQTLGKLVLAHQICFAIKTVTPKTTETIGLLERWLVDMAALKGDDDDQADQPDVPAFAHPEVQRRMIEVFRTRSTAWVLGTSFAFEVVVLAVAGWIFYRRDF